MIETLIISGEEELLSARPGQVIALTGVNATLSAVLACRAALAGRRTLLVAENDLKASRMADDVRQLMGEAAFLPGGEIDLTRAAGSLENSWRRLEALSAVCTGETKVLCTGAEAMAQRMGRPEHFRALCMALKAGDRIAPANLTRRLICMGYERVGMVEGKGQFALRGSILDVYPPSLSQGIRIEFFDDEIDSLREFDCISQRSLTAAEQVVLTPACETLLGEEEYVAAAKRMRAALEVSEETGGNTGPDDMDFLASLPPMPDDDEDDALLFDSVVAPAVRQAKYEAAEATEKERRVSRLLEDADSLEAGVPFRRMRSWITVLTDETGSVCDWFRPDLILLCEPDRIRSRIEERNAGFAEDLASAMTRGEAVQGQQDLLQDWESIRREISGFPAGVLTEMLLSLGGIRPDIVVNTEAAGIPGYGGQIRLLKNDLAAWRAAGNRIYLLSGGSSRGKRLQESLRELGRKRLFPRKDGKQKRGKP